MNLGAFNRNPLFSFSSYEQPDDLNTSVDNGELVNSFENMVLPILQDDRKPTTVKIEIELSKPDLINLISLLKQNSDQIIKQLKLKR
jgi:hypothetical protein